MAIFNVMDYDAEGDGTTDDYQAFADAALECEPGDEIYVPGTEASYLLGTEFVLPAGVTLRGDGHESLIERGGTGAVVKITGANCVIDSVGIDMVASSNFDTAVWCAAGSSDVMVRRSRVFTSAEAGAPTWTLHAVLAQSVPRVTVEGCLVEHAQIKLGDRHAVARNNVIRHPHNFGISCVLAAADTDISYSVIENNTVINPGGSGGIYVGCDDPNTAYGKAHSLRVYGNSVVGPWGSGMVGVIGRVCLDSRDWIFERNHTDCGSTTAPNGTFGIYVQSCESGSTVTGEIHGLSFLYNTARNLDWYGVGAHVQGSDVRFVGNKSVDTRSNALYGHAGGVVGYHCADNSPSVTVSGTVS